MKVASGNARIGSSIATRQEARWFESVWMRTLSYSLIGVLLSLGPTAGSAVAQVVSLTFDGLRHVDDGLPKNYVEIREPECPAAGCDDFSVTSANGVVRGLTVSAWMRPDVLTFPSEESTGYVHWLGKGEPNQQEWTFRMYGLDNTDVPFRENRISFYVFNPEGGLGVGAFFQEPVQEKEWIHVVGVADDQRVYIYKNGSFKRCDNYLGIDGDFFGDARCPRHFDRAGNVLVINPQHGTAPVRMGTRDFNSFFEGGIREVRVWTRPLTCQEVGDLYRGSVDRRGLVAEYSLNENTGTTAHDTADSHDGDIFGAAWTSGVAPDLVPTGPCPAGSP